MPGPRKEVPFVWGGMLSCAAIANRPARRLPTGTEPAKLTKQPIVTVAAPGR